MKQLILAALLFGATVITSPKAGKNSASTYAAATKKAKKGNYASAFKAVKSILKRRPTDYTANLRCGWYSYLQADYERGLLYYGRARSAKATSLEPLFGLALCQQAMKSYDAAERTLLTGLMKSPNDYTLNSRLAYVRFLKKDFAGSRKRYLKLLELYPSDSDLEAGLGWCYYYQNKLSSARRCFKSVLVLDCTHSSALKGYKLAKKKEK